MTTNEDVRRIWDAMEEIDPAMLVTEGEAGLKARPMTPIFRREQGLIWFLSDGPSSKEFEIDRERDVAVTFSDGDRVQVSVTGHALIVYDRAVIRDLWSKPFEAFLPQGPEDESVFAIRVMPLAAELWEGPNKLVALGKMAAALVTGNAVHDMGDNIKIG